MENAALESILPFAGLPEDHLQDVSFSGDFDPHLPTSFKITETGVATLPGVGLAVSDLWELRTGRRQIFNIDTRRATAALRSTKYLRLDGAKVNMEQNQCLPLQ